MFTSFSVFSQRALVSLLLVLGTVLFSQVLHAEEQITVKPGQTLMKIMRQVYPDQRSKWPVLMREIVKSNPSSFVNGDPRTLKVGSSITLPQQSTAKPKTKKRARAATVQALNGNVTLFDDKKKTRSLKVGDQIYVGDQVLTSDAGQVKLNFIDGATIELRCNSLLNIDAYKMRTRGSQVGLSLIKGSMATKTGRIGKRGHDKYELKTPTASVKTTEAEFGVRVHQEKACGKQDDVETDGMYLAVLNGSVLMFNDAGDMKLSSGDSAVATTRSAQPAEVVSFSGMVYGDKFVEKPKVVKSKPVYKKVEQESEEPEVVDNSIPYWWMIAAALILGITF